MDYYAGIDVSLELSSVCIVDAAGKVVKESKVETHANVRLKLTRFRGGPSIWVPGDHYGQEDTTIRR